MNISEKHNSISALVKPYYPLMVVHTSGLNITANNDYGFALMLDEINDKTFKNNLNKLINGNQPFMLLLNNKNGVIDPALIELVIICLMSVNYIRENNKPVIGFVEEGEIYNNGNTAFADYILSKLKLQGWPDIHYQQLLIIKQSLLSNNDFQKQVLDDFNIIGSYILFEASTLNEAISLERNFNSFYQSGLESSTFSKKGLGAYIHAKQQHKDLLLKKAVLEEKLDNAEKTIEVIRYKYKDDYETLFKWYHNEYEILPLWYKRFGQILKVLTGKRTFKSLFNDEVKKYKS